MKTLIICMATLCHSYVYAQTLSYISSQTDGIQKFEPHQSQRFKEFNLSTHHAPDERVTGWLSDLDFLVSRMQDQHINLFHTCDQEEWKKAVADLKRNIPIWSDLQIIGGFMSLMAKIGDGHTLLYPPFQGNLAFKALPIELYFFKKDLYIRATTPEHQSIVGEKVVKIGGLSVKQVLEEIDPFISRDNDYQFKWIAPIALSFFDIYELIGLETSSGSVLFELEASDGSTTTYNVPGGPLMRNPMSRFAPPHWVDMLKEPSANWTKDPENFYWYDYNPENQLIYFQFNQVQNKEEQSLMEFVGELEKAILTKQSKALVIDIRLNNGGNNFLNKNLIEMINRNKQINKKEKLFTIIGRRTFSAAMNLASDLENETKTLFVGEPTGSRPNFYGEDNEFELPYSKLTGSISNRYWQGGRNAKDDREWISPDLPAELTAENYVQNVDPAMEAIIEYLKKN